MESKIHSVVITSILAFALISAVIPAAFENVFAQGEGKTIGDEGGNITDGAMTNGGTGTTDGTTSVTGE